VPEPTWRALTPADLPPWHRTVAAADQVDRTEQTPSIEDLTDELSSPQVDPATDSIAAVSADGEVLAAGFATARPLGGPIRRYDLWGTVHPEHRRQGLGSRLLAWQLDRAARRQRDDRTPVEGWAGVGLEDHRDDLRHFLQRAGLVPLRWYTGLRRPLATPIESAPVPDSIRLVPFDQTRSEQARQVHNHSWADHWGFAPRPADHWHAWTTGHRNFRADWSFLAVTDADAVIGYVVNFAWEQEWQHKGFSEGYTELLGVARDWRGAGVASALLAASNESFRASGIEFAALDVDSDNLTGALRLYQSLGYLPKSRTQLMAARLDPAATG